MSGIFSALKLYFKKSEPTANAGDTTKASAPEAQEDVPVAKEEPLLNTVEKPSGAGIKKKWVIGAVGIIAFLVMCSLMFGVDRKKTTIKSEEQPRVSEMQNMDGNHLRDVPTNYTDAAKQEVKAENTAAPKEVRPVQRPQVPPQPQSTRRTQTTPEQQAKRKEYEAMLKAHASPIRFELSNKD